MSDHVNEVFREYATSTAFSITLSKLQCHALLRTARDENRECIISVGTLRGLEARGLVSWSRDSKGCAFGFNGLTEEGKAVVKLLELAGLTVENTVTVSIASRVQRAQQAA